MKNKFLFLVFLPLSFFAQNYIPTSAGEIVRHHYYTLSYSEDNEQAAWVCYKLTPEMVNGTYERKNDFRSDKMVATGSAELSDYVGSGYDKGHLAPANDMKVSALAMSESFFLSNTSPQTPSFNRGGLWRKLENKVNSWGKDTVIVVTGPIFKDNIGTVGSNKVTVPGYFYKVIYAPSKQAMIGFVLPQVKVDKELKDCVVKVDRIEEETGIDFFPQLEDLLEDQLEGTVCLAEWDL